MKSLNINALQATTGTLSRQGLIRIRKGSLQRGFFLVLVAVLAIFIGLFIPFLGFQSAYSVLIVFLVFGMLVGSAIVVYYAARGRKWALLLFLVFSVFLIDATFRMREMTDQSVDAQTLLKLGVWCSALVIAFFSTPRLGAGLFQGDIKWLTLFSLLALASTSYSLTPAYTFGGGIASVSYCALAVCITQHLTRQQILYSLLIGMSIVLAISLAIFIIMGWGTAALEGGSGLRVGGIAGSANSLGKTASMVILVVTVLVISDRLPIYNWRCILPIVLASTCLVLSDSRTATIALIAGFGLYLLRVRPQIGFTVIIFFASISLVLSNLDIPWHELGVFFSRSGRLSEMTTLTGRTDIWYATWNAFLEHPLLGYGYGSTKILLPQVYRGFWGFTVNHAHNLYLQTLVTTGLIGLALILMTILRQIISYITRPEPFPAAVIGYIMLYGLTEGGPIGTTPNILTFIWALSLCWDRARRDPEKSPRTGR